MFQYSSVEIYSACKPQPTLEIHNPDMHKDAPRGSRIAEFLLDGNLVGPLKKTVSDLDEYDRYAFEFCRKVASHYSKQLFAIYQNKEALTFIHSPGRDMDLVELSVYGNVWRGPDLGGCKIQ